MSLRFPTKAALKAGLALSGAAFAFAFAAPASAQLGPDAAACRSGGQAVLVTVDGFRARTGNIRVAIYGSDPSLFLARGRTLRKVNVPVTGAGPMRICVALPGPGRYAVAVRHDVNGNNARGDWSDGAGFSRNPRISLTNLRPNYNNVAINVGRGVTPVSVVLNYRFGLSIRPVA
jgi:uncharacterized protein (DUF2141 family)